MRSLRWVVFISAAAILVARITNTTLGGLLEPAPYWRVPEPETKPLVPRELRLTNVERLFPRLGGAGPDHPPPDPSAPVTTNRKLRLLALLVSDHEALSSGFVMDETRTAWLIRTGDDIGDLRVERFSRDPFRVEVWNRTLQRREFILGGDEAGAATPSVSPDIQVVDATHRVIPRPRLVATLANLGALAQDAQWMPITRDGHTSGWQVRGIRPGSVLESIGLKSGDTVLRINGLDLNGPEKALEAYQRLQEAALLDVDIERSGTPVRMSYRIDG